MEREAQNPVSSPSTIPPQQADGAPLTLFCCRISHIGSRQTGIKGPHCAVTPVSEEKLFGGKYLLAPEGDGSQVLSLAGLGTFFDKTTG